MADDAKVTLYVKVQKIYPVYSLVRNPSTFPGDSPDSQWAINVKVRFTGRWCEGEIAIGVEMRVIVNEPDADHGPIIDEVAVCEYLISGLRETPRDEDGRVILPKRVASLLLGSSYSTMRGWIAHRTLGMWVDDIHLPVSENAALFEQVIGKEFDGIHIELPDPSKPQPRFLEYVLTPPNDQPQADRSIEREQ